MLFACEGGPLLRTERLAGNNLTVGYLSCRSIGGYTSQLLRRSALDSTMVLVQRFLTLFILASLLGACSSSNPPPPPVLSDLVVPLEIDGTTIFRAEGVGAVSGMIHVHGATALWQEPEVEAVRTACRAVGVGGRWRWRRPKDGVYQGIKRGTKS